MKFRNFKNKLTTEIHDLQHTRKNRDGNKNNIVCKKILIEKFQTKVITTINALALAKHAENKLILQVLFYISVSHCTFEFVFIFLLMHACISPTRIF